LDVTCFKPFKTTFRKEIIFAIMKNNYLELDKVTLTMWMDKALQQSLKNENIKSRFRVSGIWPLNLITMVGKFGPSDVFTVAKEEEHELSYHSNAIDEPSNSEVEVAMMC
jgi:hypothetical protein